VSNAWLAIISVAAFVFAAFFAGAETAILAADRIRVRHRASLGDKRAQELLSLFDNPERFLSIVLVGTNLGVIGCTSAFTAIMVNLMGDRGATVATVMLVPSLLLFEEILPKAIFLYYADSASVLSAYPLKIVGFVLYPVIKTFSWISTALMKLSRTGQTDPRVQMTPEELLFHLKDSREAGLISKDTAALAERVFELVDLAARDVMVSIDGVVMVREGMEIHEYQTVFSETGFTRLPVYRRDRTDVSGILSIQSLLDTRRPNVDRPELEPVYDVELTTPITEILVQMKNQGCHMAMIRNEEGTTVGMTTLEDILERLVGAISDEFH
jgi:CBS domain containing-hemolysin-like protein